MGKTGRGKRNQENEDDIASLLLSNTRAGTAYLLPHVTKVDVSKVDVARSIWGAALKMKENGAQLSTSTTAAQAVANAAAVEAAAGAATSCMMKTVINPLKSLHA
jgi:hypothetical protein